MHSSTAMCSLNPYRAQGSDVDASQQTQGQAVPKESRSTLTQARTIHSPQG